jgi:hypothetical protein
MTCDGGKKKGKWKNQKRQSQPRVAVPHVKGKIKWDSLKAVPYRERKRGEI